MRIFRKEQSGAQYRYDTTYRLGERPLSPAVNRVYEKLSSQKRVSTVLDIGCGAGRFALNAPKDRNWRVIGVDINEDAVGKFRDEISRRGLHDVSLHGDVREIGLENEQIDAAVAWRVFHALPVETQHAFARKVFDLLPPGGSFFVAVASHEDWKAQALQRQGRYNPHGQNDCSEIMDVPEYFGVDFFTPEKLHTLGRSHGFQVVGIETFEEPSGYDHLRTTKPDNKYLLAEFRKPLQAA